MIFLHEEFLYLLLLPLIFTLYTYVKKPKALLSVFSPEVLKKLSHSKQGLPTMMRVILFALAASMMIIALAQPVIEKEKVKLNQKAIDLIIAMDISRSMEAKDSYPNRLEWAKRKIQSMIDQSDAMRVGVMAFAQNAYVVTPITEDKDVAKYLLENLDTKNITENGTNIMQLLDTSAQQLEKTVHKYVLLVTDGGDAKEFTKEIAFAKEKKLTLFILSIGTKKGAPIETANGGFIKDKSGKILLTHLNESIKALALQTGGVYIHSISSSKDITTMIQEIKNIAKASSVTTKEVKSFVEYFSYFLMLSIALLFIAFHSLPQKKSLLFIVSLFLLPAQDLEASLTDFQTIEKARTAYEAKDFNTAQSSLETLSKESPSVAIDYNIANTLYKQKKYDEAIKKYQSIPETSKYQHKILHNMGNAYAQSKKLDEAIKAYEKALSIEEDKETRENLEAVKKMKEKQKKEDKKKNKDKKDDKNKKDKKNKKDNKKSKDSDKKESDKKNKSDKDKKKKNEKKSKKDKKKKEKSSKTEDEKQSQEKKEDEKARQEKEVKPVKRSQKDLTDKEEKKLMKLLHKQKGQTFRYKIPSKFEKDNHDKQPW